MDPILPAIPPVRPRVLYDGDDRPLDEFVEELLADGVRGIVALTRRRQSGKTTILSFLDARFLHDADSPLAPYRRRTQRLRSAPGRFQLGRQKPRSFHL
jgi:hypothetical protein